MRKEENDVHIFTKQKFQNAMKNIFSLIFAGVVGGLIVLGASKLGSSNDTLVREFNQSPSASLVSSNSVIAEQPFDFVRASELATEVVVHIVAEESVESARKRSEQRRKSRRNPFDDLFGNDFFGQDFFRGHAYPKNGSGSGVIISKDGYIVTNNHVVGFADNILVTLEDGREVKATKIGTDPTTDLAVIKIDVDGNLPTLEFSDSDKVRVGEWVLAVGNPFSYLTSTVTAGIVSAKGRDLDIISEDKSIEEFIQTDAAVNPGNSGGALVNTQGKLVGINTAIATRTGSFQGYSFAIPVNMMTKIVEDIIEFGSYQRGFLGINIADLDNDFADELGLNITQGVVVIRTVEGGAAQYAGVLPNDVITKVNGSKVKSAPELQELVGRKRLGDTVTLTINRGGKIKQIPVTLKKG